MTRAAEEREPGGLAIAVVRQFCDRLDYERGEGRNRVTVVVRTGD